MQGLKFEILQPNDLIKNIELSFMAMPLVTRDCVRSLNILFYNMQSTEFSKEIYREIIIFIMKGFTSKDQYLKAMIYVFLEDVSKKTDDVILAVNSLVKDIEDKHTAGALKNLAYRALFSILPANMRYDFQSYIRNILIDSNSRDIAICLASKYFKDLKVPINVTGSISDYHCSYFNKLPINQYSSLLEFKKLYGDNKNVAKIADYINSSTEPDMFFEAIKTLILFNPEIIAPYVDRMVSVLKYYLQRDEVEEFLAIKILNNLSCNFANKVSKINREIENLVQSSSLTVSMLAIVTLLITGTDETVKHLVAKIKPLMHTMSEAYKIIAIEAMEKLSKESKKEFVEFLISVFKERSEIMFKRYLLKKLESLIIIDELKPRIFKFLFNYIEDPEHFQLSMDILGILGQHINTKKDLIHIYNRLILDNSHVRMCAYQSLFNLSDKFDTMQCFNNVEDPDTSNIRAFLALNTNLKKGDFNISELGDLKEEVLKYADIEILTEINKETVLEGDFIKECRPICLTSANSDFEIILIKKISVDKIVLCFSIENKMEKVVVTGGTLGFVTTDSSNSKFNVDIKTEDFAGAGVANKEVEVSLSTGTALNGVFNYNLCFEEDYDEIENDTISLLPFDINILDYVRPTFLSVCPENSKDFTLKFKLSITDAISKIVGAANMFIIAEKDKFELMGTYNRIPIVIKGNAVSKKYTSVDMQVFCDDDVLIDQIISIYN